MHGVQTSVVQKDKEVTGKDLRSPAINVARMILCLSSHQRAGRSYVAIVSVRVVPNQGVEVKN
jgi:hypothetical protein